MHHRNRNRNHNHRPYWRLLRLLVAVSITFCIVFVYFATWNNNGGEEGRALQYLPLGGYGAAAVTKLSSSLPSLPGSGLVLDGFPGMWSEGLRSGSGSGGDGKGNGNGPGVWKGNGGGGGVVGKKGSHPIDQLIKHANADFEKVIATEATSLADAAAKYRKRRGRHPPPGFDAWYHYATERGAVVVEQFFDQIYHDLGPFWGVPPATLRLQATGLTPRIVVKSGNVTIQNPGMKVTNEKVEGWAAMLRALARQKHVALPDMEVPVNGGDGASIVLAPWETVDTALSMARPMLPSPLEVLTEYSSASEKTGDGNSTWDPEYVSSELLRHSPAMRPYWTLVRPACRPDSPSRDQILMEDIWHPDGHVKAEHSPPSLLLQTSLNYTFGGFVRNWTTSTDACLFPEWQGLHGAFVGDFDPASQKLFPLFGGGKFGVSNDVVMPNSEEWKSMQTREGEEENKQLRWKARLNKLFWRGPASGGRNTKLNWQRFHRHRFVSMLNASHVAAATARQRPHPRFHHRREEQTRNDENGAMQSVDPAGTFVIPSSNPYQISAQQTGWLSEWISSFADVAFTDLKCDPLDSAPAPSMPGEKICSYTDPWYSVALSAKPGEQDRYKFSAALDGDGGNDNDDLIEKLASGLVTLRASVYRQWYDSRLLPWVHYVPMDNTLVDLYAIMEYFLGSTSTPTPISQSRFRKAKAGGGKKKAHDAEAENISGSAREWAAKVLRREDMLIYVYRLVLEWSRVVEDSRERLGFVGDLLDMDG